MQSPLFTLITRLFSFLAVGMMFAAAAVTASGSLGISVGSEITYVVVFGAGIIGFVTIVLLNFSNAKMRGELKDATEIAHALSQGETFDEESSSELLDSLASISAYLEEKRPLFEQIAGGNLNGNVDIRSDADAFGQSMQTMVERLREVVQTQDERNRLQKSIVKLLNEVSEVAAGDLTVHAEVSPEMTGQIAEAFNSMTKELRSLIKQVKDVTVQVSGSATAINDTTEQLARGSEAQASQIQRTTIAIAGMASQIQEVSENASLSAQVAGDSLNNALFGSKAVQDNINAMNSIRKQVQETAKRIKKLGERSQEISQIVQLIDDLSDRTSLLALNASLHASSVGSSEMGFAVVAEEVERLAERSNRLTQQIGTLSQTIQSETKDVVASMEETIHEVVVGSTLADRAGQALVEIEKVSQRLNELLHSISDSAKHQAKSSEDISNAMANISNVTELVQIGSKRAADSVKRLVELSDELRVSVSPFKLPEDTTVVRPTNPVNTTSSAFLN